MDRVHTEGASLLPQRVARVIPPARFFVPGSVTLVAVKRLAILLGASFVLAGCGQDQRPGDEAVLDGSAPSKRAGLDKEKPEGAPRVVQVVPPGGLKSGVDAATEEKRLRAENKRIRRDLEDLAALEKARKRVQRQLAKAGYDSNLVVGAGGLAWPVNGTVSSQFGPRWGRLHAGIDISAPAGRVIRAAEAGRVSLRGVVSGYGNYTCVQHSLDFQTCYAHQSRFLVDKGDDVDQGQAIGLVGCTGRCFGDHLHFEVYVNNRPTDPMPYL